MKKKIGEIYNKPIVTGDKNLVTKNEIHESSLGGNNGGGSSRVEYWGISDKFDINASFEEDPASAYLYMTINLLGGYFKGIVASSEKVAIVSAYTTFNHYVNNKTLFFKSYKAFTFSPVFTEQEKYNTFNDALKLTNEQGVNLYDLVYPITEEEFYNLNNSDNSGESTVKEGDLIYYTLNDSFTSIRNITDNITQIAVGRGESMSSGSIGNLNRFVDIQDVTINKGDGYVSISIPNFIVVDMPAFVYKVGSDLKTAEDIIGNSSVTRITKEEYDNIFNM